MLSCCQQDTLAASLLDEGLALLDGTDGADPVLMDVVVDDAYSAE